MSETTVQSSVTGRWIVAADIGGTFTDVLVLGPRGEVVPAKVLSTPPDFGSGVIEAAKIALEAAGALPEQVTSMLHGTTVATNAILERRGARTGLVTTEGFRDVLELGRLRRPSLYDMLWERPRPLAERRYRYELSQRIQADASIAKPVSDDDVVRIASEAALDGVQAIAVCFINSHLRPDVERAVAARLQELLPAAFVTASVDVSPQMNEYERSSTAVVNAYVGPIVHNYLIELERNLQQAAIAAPLMIMQSNGGLLDAETVSRHPVQIIESGPAAGVMAAQKLSRALSLANVVAFDMGGTTAKASMIEAGQAFVAGDYEVGGGMNVARGLGRGAGYTIRVPSVDIAEVGAGGGSLIAADPAGVLHVGPQSAGSCPGPACYGVGGSEATLTDANVVLGYLSPEALAGGRVVIHPDLAAKAVAEVAGTIGLSAEVTARGAYDVAVSSMTTAVRAVTSERGRDPRDATLIAFGGAGPLYCAALAKELGITTIIVPAHPGLFSSVGLLVADTEVETVAPHTWATPRTAVIQNVFETIEAELTESLADAVGGQELEVLRLLDMRYRGQRFELRIPVESTLFDESAFQHACASFHNEHQRTYGRAETDDLIEIVNLRVRAALPSGVLIENVLAVRGESRSVERSRMCWFDEFVATPVLGRHDLDGWRAGPLVIEDMDATILVPPGAAARRDHMDSVVISWNPPETGTES